MTVRRSAHLATIASLLAIGAVLPAAGAAGQTSAQAEATPLVACGDGPAFPLAALDGRQGAEMAGDGPARRLAQAATTGEAGYVPRGGWVRVLDEPDRAVFATWVRPPRSADGPLLQVTLGTEVPGAPDPDAWSITSAGFCWPRAIPPAGSGLVPWTLAAPAGADASELTIVPAVPLCADTRPVVVLTPEHVALTVIAPTGGWVCYGPPATTLAVSLPEPLGSRDLLDGVFDPPIPVQAAPPAVPDPDRPPLDPASVTVAADARPVAIAASRAFADSLDTGPRLIEVDVVDTLEVSVRLLSEEDLVLAGPPQLCLVGPFPAPDDAGLIDRCWGDPDPGAAFGPRVPRTVEGWPILRAGEPVSLQATIARGEVRCDYPPGEWRLEVVLTPLVGGHGWTDVALPEVPLAVDATGLAPARELGRGESRYCGMAIGPSPEPSAGS